MLLIQALCLAFVLGSESSSASKTWKSLDVEGGKTLEYAVVTPADFDPETAYPVVVALPPGPQSRGLVDTGLELYFEAEAIKRGWVVISPAAPEGNSFHKGLDLEFDALLDLVESEYKIAGGVVHLAGVSNGGRSGFHQAGRAPSRFASLSALPGLPSSDEDWAALDGLAELPVAIWAGAEDADWVASAERAVRRLTELQAPELHLGIMAGQGHVLDASFAAELFDRLDFVQARQLERVAHAELVAGVLDNLHDAADKADEERYFGLFAPTAIFIGTDKTERWTVAEFRAYAEEPFKRESAWTYASVERHIRLSNDGNLAWFDERLSNAKYGETRGSGVLVRRGDQWKIAHYVLSFEIPNEIAKEVVRVVRESGK